MRVAFRLDIASYYLFVVLPLYKNCEAWLRVPPFSTWQSVPFFQLMRFYNARLASMGRERRRRGIFGKTGAPRRDFVPGFNFRISQLLKIFFHGLGIWIGLELCEGWRTWLPRADRRETTSQEGVPAVAR
jgi:hypothetical protein